MVTNYPARSIITIVQFGPLRWTVARSWSITIKNVFAKFTKLDRFTKTWLPSFTKLKSNSSATTSNIHLNNFVVVVWRGIHSRSDTNRTGAEGLFFYCPRLLHCLNHMLAVMSLSQHRVSSSKTVRSRAPYGARCIGHAVSTWSAVCSEAPHSQFGEGARPHLCMDKSNRPTPVHRQRFRAADTNGRLDLSLTWRVSEDPLKRPYKIWSGSRYSRWAKESVAPSRRSSAGWMSESTDKWSVGVGRRHLVTMRKASFKTLSMRRVWALRHQTGAQYSAVD